MANSAGMAIQAKSDFMIGTHVLGTDTLKAALYLASATTGPTTSAYTATGEVTGTGYTAGGVTVTSATAPAVNGTEGVFTPSASIVFTGVTLATSFDTVMLYNSSKTNKSLATYTFGAQTITAGTLTLTMPANTAGNALLRIT